MLSMVGAMNEQQKDFVRKIHESVEQMTQLVDNLLDLGRIEAGVGLNLEAVNVDSMVQDVSGAYQAQAANKRIMLATDLADHLVKSGVPFRHAHELVGKAVAEAIRTGAPLDQLDLTTIDPAFGPDAKDVFSLERALEARSNPGAPSITNVRAEIRRWKKDL